MTNPELPHGVSSVETMFERYKRLAAREERREHISEIEKIKDIRSRIFAILAAESGGDRAKLEKHFNPTEVYDVSDKNLSPSDRDKVGAMVPEYAQYLRQYLKAQMTKGLFSRRPAYEVRGRIEATSYSADLQDIYDAPSLPARQTHEYVTVHVRRFSGDMSISDDDYHFDDELIVGMSYGYNFDVTDPVFGIAVNTRSQEIAIREGREKFDGEMLAGHTNEELLDRVLTAAAQDRRVILSREVED